MYKSFSSVEELPSDCIVFKHSITCPISAAAKKEMDEIASDQDVYLLIVQEQQDLKMKVAERFGVEHESPQALIVKEGKVISVFNHGEVTALAIRETF